MTHYDTLTHYDGLHQQHQHDINNDTTRTKTLPPPPLPLTPPHLVRVWRGLVLVRMIGHPSEAAGGATRSLIGPVRS